MPIEPNREETLFAGALNLTPAKRAEFLERECAGDAALRARVESLLAAHAEAGTHMDLPIAGPAAVHFQEGDTSPRSEQSGERIGRYRLLEKIGEGGFGDVWMAEQEEPVRRRVALKIIKLGMDTREVVARFEAERQALALMDHPNIARVFDGGATESGRPYFVMELVRGVPITAFCDAHRLKVDERLELFMQVCQAMQHAHQKGIIHRDVKPSNVLVAIQDDRPVPKVIDFGIAKAMAQRLTEKTLFTRFHQFVGTPAYMSPEQTGSNRDDVDTRSDIYSLGVLLYELLTGRTPFDTARLLDAGYEAILKTVREKEPPKPSTRLSTLTHAEREELALRRKASPDRLTRLLRGELDWVVMKALEKDRLRRYATAADLAGDLQRYLRSEPVVAAPPSLVYKMRRFMARNRLAVGFAGSVGLLLVATTVLAIRSAVVEGRQKIAFATQRDIATNQAALARAATEQAQRTLGELAETLSQLEIQKVTQLLEPSPSGQTDVGFALAQLARSVRQNPQDFRATYRLLALLTQRDFGRPLRQRATEGALLDVAWLDGSLVLAVSSTNSMPGTQSGQVSFFDFESGRRIRGPILEGMDVSSFTFSPSMRRFWVFHPQPGTSHNQILVGDTETGRAVGPAIALDGWGGQVEFDPKEEKIAMRTQPQLGMASGQSIEVFDIQTGRLFGKPLNLAERNFAALAFDTEGRRLIISNFGMNTAPRVFDFERGKIEEIKPDASARGNVRPDDLIKGIGADALAAMLPLSGVAAYRQADHRSYLGSDQFTAPRVFGAPTVTVSTGGRVNGFAVFSPDGTRLAVAYTDTGTVQLWDIHSTRARSLPISYPDHGEPQYSDSGGSLDDGGRRFARVVGTNAMVWDLRSGGLLTKFAPQSSSLSKIHLSPDGELLLTIAENRARLYTSTNGQPRGEAFGATAAGDISVVDGLFCPDGKTVLTWSPRGEGRAWNVDTLAPSGAFGPEGNENVKVRVNADGSRVATFGGGPAAHVWEIASGRALSPALLHTDTITTAEFSPDGETLVTGSKDGTAQIWDVRDGRARTPALLHGGPVSKAVMLARAGRIATVGEDRKLKLWDLASGNLVQTVEVERNPESELLAAAEGRLLMNVGYQSRVLDPITGAPLSDQISDFSGGQYGAVSRDGGVLVTSGGSRAANVFALPMVSSAAPAWLSDLAEAIVARKLTAQGVAVNIPFGEVQQTLERLKSQSGDDLYSRWVRWYLATDPGRPVSPGLEVTRTDFVRMAAQSGDGDVARGALELEPQNVSLLEALASQSIGSLLPELQASMHFPDEATRVRTILSAALDGASMATQILALAPESIPAWQLRAVAQAWLQDTNAALDALSHLTVPPTTPQDWLLRGFVSEVARRMEEADQAYARAAALESGRGSGFRSRYREARIAFLRRQGRHEEALREQLSERGISGRAASTDPRLLDLGPYYTGSLARPFQSGYSGDDLDELPGGVSTLAGVPFEIRGVVDRPVSGIPVERTLQRLHFLVGCTSLWLGPTNERPAGLFVAHFADGERIGIPVIGGRHVRDWFILPDEPAGVPEAEIAWIGTNQRSREQAMRLRLFKRTWQNPRPEQPIVKVDFDKQDYVSGLFLLAVTADDGQLPSGPAENPLVRAEIAEATGKAEQGLPLVDAALQEHPGDGRLQVLKARLLAAGKRHSEAVELISSEINRFNSGNGDNAAAKRTLLALRSGWLKVLGRDAEALADSLALRGIPARAPNTPAECLDLSPFYNAGLIGSWHPGQASNDLAALPVGLQELGGVRFDIRGVVQLAGNPTLQGTFPLAQTNLTVNRSFSRIQALHATGWMEKNGKIIGAIRLHFANGQQHDLPIVFGEDVRDWNEGSDPVNTLTRGAIVWRGRNGANFRVRLFLSTWKNPFPQEQVTRLDYVSAQSNSAPFLVALTVGE